MWDQVHKTKANVHKRTSTKFYPLEMHIYKLWGNDFIIDIQIFLIHIILSI